MPPLVVGWARAPCHPQVSFFFFSSSSFKLYVLILGNHLPDEEDKESRETPKVRKRMGGKSCMHAYPTNVAGVNLSDGSL